MKLLHSVFCAGLLLATVFIPAQVSAQTLAFPTAEGFGKYATGGRGGEVVEVTNLDDSGEGSLRWALSQYPTTPFTVVFRVSGVIKLASDIRCNRNGMTIAGQTAPGDGICIRGAKLNLGGSKNLVIRHIRSRIGGKTDEGVFIPGGSIDIENASDFMIDHCTFGWSAEENMTIYDNKRTTIQWCLVHEGLYTSGHSKGERSYASQWGGQFSTYHHNLLAHNNNRTPRFNGARGSNDVRVLTDYVNNVNYNWGKPNSCYGGDINNNTYNHINMVGNYYKPGPARPIGNQSYFVQASYGGTSKVANWYLSGNVMEGDAAMTSNNNTGVDLSPNPAASRDTMIVNTPFYITPVYSVNTETAQKAYESVLAGAGAFPRDVVDLRIIDETRNGTASGKGTVEKYPSSISGTDTTWVSNHYYGLQLGIIDAPSAVGGYPSYNTSNTITDNDHDGMDDAWEIANGFDPTNKDDRNVRMLSGYTALEVYLNSLVGESIPLEIDHTGISNQFVSDKISVYPSPASDKLYIGTEHNLVSGDIFGTDGCLIKKVIFNNVAIANVADLHSGNYILVLTTADKQKATVRFLKK